MNPCTRVDRPELKICFLRETANMNDCTRVDSPEFRTTPSASAAKGVEARDWAHLHSDMQIKKYENGLTFFEMFPVGILRNPVKV